MPVYGTLAGALLASVAAIGIGAGLDDGRTLMTRQDYELARQRAASELRIALGACRGLADGPRSLCRASARAEDKVRLADLEARYRGTVGAQEDARLAKLRSRLDLSRARCQGLAGAQRAACMSPT